MADTSSRSKSSEDVTLNFGCLCNAVQGTFSLPTSSLPLPLELCHCWTCRHHSGLPAVTSFDIPTSHTSTFKITGDSTGYEALPNLLPYFCTTCGSKIYTQNKHTKQIFPYSGIVDLNNRTDILGPIHHVFLSSTNDGGISIWFPNSRFYTERPNSTELDAPTFLRTTKQASLSLPRTQHPSNLKPGPLPCTCHCGALTFSIAAPPTSAHAIPPSHHSGTYSDLLVPATDPKKHNPDNEAWFLRPSKSGGSPRYLTGLCACTSCRKASGMEIQAWAFIPTFCLLNSNTNEILDFDTLHARGMKTHNSSKGTYRFFCGICGATAFWRSDERSGVVDVSVGLVQAGEGGGMVRAEEWLEWWMGRVSFWEEAEGRGVVGGLREGMRRWEEDGGG